MAQGRSGYSWAGTLFGKGLGAAWWLVLSPFKLARRAANDLVGGGSYAGQRVLAAFMWAFYGVLALFLAALANKVGWLTPVQYLLATTGVLFLASFGIYLKTRGLQAQARMRKALNTIEANTTQTRRRVERIEQQQTAGGGGEGFDVFKVFRANRQENPSDRMRREQAEQVRQWMPEGEAPPTGFEPIFFKWPWRRKK